MAVQEPTILDQIQSGLGTIVPSGGGGELITPTPTIPNSTPLDPVGTTIPIVPEPNIGQMQLAPKAAAIIAGTETSVAPTATAPSTAAQAPSATANRLVTASTAVTTQPVSRNINYLVIGLGAVLVLMIAGKLMSSKD